MRARARTVRSGRKEGERKVQGRWEEGQLLQLIVAAVTSSPDVLVPKKPSSPDVIDAGRGPSTRPSPSPICSTAPAPAWDICGSEVGPPVHHKAAATPTAKLFLVDVVVYRIRSLDEPTQQNVFFFIFYGKVQIIF